MKNKGNVNKGNVNNSVTANNNRTFDYEEGATPFPMKK